MSLMTSIPPLLNPQSSTTADPFLNCLFWPRFWNNFSVLNLRNFLACFLIMFTTFSSGTVNSPPPDDGAACSSSSWGNLNVSQICLWRTWRCRIESMRLKPTAEEATLKMCVCFSPAVFLCSFSDANVSDPLWAHAVMICMADSPSPCRLLFMPTHKQSSWVRRVQWTPKWQCWPGSAGSDLCQH